MKITMTKNEILAGKSLLVNLKMSENDIRRMLGMKSGSALYFATDCIADINKKYNNILSVAKFNNSVGTECYTISIKEEFITDTIDVYGRLGYVIVTNVVRLVDTLKEFFHRDILTHATKWGLHKNDVVDIPGVKEQQAMAQMNLEVRFGNGYLPVEHIDHDFNHEKCPNYYIMPFGECENKDCYHIDCDKHGKHEKLVSVNEAQAFPSSQPTQESQGF